MKLYHLFIMWLVGIVLGVNLTTMILLPILSYPDHLNGLEVPPRRVEVVEKTVIQEIESKKQCPFSYFWLKGYDGLDSCLRKSILKTYQENIYDCTEFSRDLHLCLREQGIDSYVIHGRNGKDEGHSYVGVLFEATTGMFIKPEDNYKPGHIRTYLEDGRIINYGN